MKKEITINSNEAKFLQFIIRKQEWKKYKYYQPVATNYYKIQTICGFKSIDTTRRMIERLGSKKLVDIRKLKNEKGKLFLTVSIIRPRVLDRLLKEHNDSVREDSPSLDKIPSKLPQSSDNSTNNNNNIINQINHKPNTIAQDMMRIYNDDTGGPVLGLSKTLCQYLVAAFKQKFHSLKRWALYIRHKKRGKIRNKLGFLMYLLSFQVINLEMPALEAMEKFEYARQKQLAVIRQKQLQEDSCFTAVRKECLQELGYERYDTWIKLLIFSRENNIIEYEAPNTFIRDYVMTYFEESILRATKKVIPGIMGIKGRVTMNAAQHIANCKESQACKYARQKFVQTFGKYQYMKFMTQVNLNINCAGLGVFAADTDILDHVMKNYYSSLKKWIAESKE